jgi:putative DNA primase/helicase
MATTEDDGSKKPRKPSPASRLELVPGAAAFAERDRWQGRDDTRLATNEKGALLPTVGNLVMILRNDQAWQGVLAYNEFSGVVVKRKAPPFVPTEPGEWTDLDDSRLSLWLDTHYGLRKMRERDMQDGVILTADQNRFHEVRDFLRALKWDGTVRLPHWLHLYMGADQTPYTALAGSKFLIGACARVMRAPEPVKMDNVLIFESKQDAGKSTALEILFTPWFTDAAFEIGSTDGNQIIRGMWGVELAEMDGYNRAEVSKSKAFFSRKTDRYRNPYGRKPVNVVRQGVFAGSVNPAGGGYLKDPTGNRRYWPVKCGYIALDELAADREQLWAEALAEYTKGTVWWVRASEAALFEEAQEERYVGDAYEDRIATWLDTIDVDLKKDQVTTGMILGKALNLEISKWTLAEQQRVGRIMARLGWPRRKSGSRNSREWMYFRPTTPP